MNRLPSLAQGNLIPKRHLGPLKVIFQYIVRLADYGGLNRIKLRIEMLRSCLCSQAGRLGSLKVNCEQCPRNGASQSQHSGAHPMVRQNEKSDAH